MCSEAVRKNILAEKNTGYPVSKYAEIAKAVLSLFIYNNEKVRRKTWR